MPARPASKPATLVADDVLRISEGIEENFRSQLKKGLFADRDAAATEVIESLTAAFKALESGDVIGGNEHMLAADLKTYRVVYDRGWWWRFRVRFHPMVVLYNLLILVYLFVAGGWEFDPDTVPRWLQLPDEVWQIPVAVLAFGAAGAVLRVFYWLHLKVARGEARPRNQLGYFLAPWIGALFGAIVYAIVRAGLWTFQGQAVDDAEPKLWAVLALAALAGYSWEWITQWLTNVMSKVAERGGVPAEKPAGAAAGASAPASGAGAGKPPAPTTPKPPPEKPAPPSLDELPDQPEGD